MYVFVHIWCCECESVSLMYTHIHIHKPHTSTNTHNNIYKQQATIAHTANTYRQAAHLNVRTHTQFVCSYRDHICLIEWGAARVYCHLEGFASQYQPSPMFVFVRVCVCVCVCMCMCIYVCSCVVLCIHSFIHE